MMTRLRSKPEQDWQGRHFYTAQSLNADQAEWQALKLGTAHVSAGTMDDEMAESADQDVWPEARSADLLQGKEVVQEAIQGAVLEIIQDREKILGDAYPFSLTGNSLEYTPRGPGVYEFLLAVVNAPSLSAGEYAKLPRVFEELSCLAAIGFLGGAAKGYRTGWPRPQTTATFKCVVEEVRRVTGAHGAEWQWCPDSDLPEDPAPAFVKDEGLDVIAWRPWLDQRGGQLYILGQCACGEGWLNKGQDISEEALNRWFKPTRVKPLRSLFTPYYAVRDIVVEMSIKAGLVFDRTRMVQCLQAENVIVDLAKVMAQANALLQMVKEGSKPPTKAKKGKRISG